MAKEISFKRAVLEIGISTLVISGGAFCLLQYYQPFQNREGKEALFPIVSIVQTGPQKEALKTVYLAELLELSCDKPTSFVQFDIKKAKNKLLLSPVIKEALVKIEKPGTLIVDYTVRKPVAKVADFTNCGIDEEGYLFPIYPFFSPKNLPEIYFGLEPFDIFPKDPFKPKAEWNTPLKGQYYDIAAKVLALINSPTFADFFNVKKIDVASAFLESAGMREIVITMEDEILQKKNGKEIKYILPRILRLSTKNYAQELGNYLNLRKELLEQESLNLPISSEPIVKLPFKILDFRIPNLAFIQKHED